MTPEQFNALVELIVTLVQTMGQETTNPYPSVSQAVAAVDKARAILVEGRK